MRHALKSSLLWGLLLIVAPSTFAQEPSAFYPSRYYPDAPDRSGAVPLALEPGEGSPNLVFSLPSSGGMVQARILSEETGNPIRGLLVEACVGRFGSFGRTAADGTVTIPGVPAGSVVLRTRPDDLRSETGAHAIRYAPGVIDSTFAQRLELADGGLVDFDTIEIPTGGRVKATVLDPEGSPWESVAVILRSAETPLRRLRRTDPQGRITFGGLEPGSYRLWADTRGTPAVSEAWDGSRDTLTSTPLVLGRGELVEGIEITPDRGGRIIGAIRHRSTNAGLPDLEVHVFPATDPTEITVAYSDAIGFYRVTGLRSGSYKVFVPAIRRYFPEAETLEEARPVLVTEPDITSGIDIRGLPVPDCTIGQHSVAVIEGIVRADFYLLPSARIVVWSEDDTASITVTEAGLYRHDCLVSGTYRAAIFPDGVYSTQYHRKVSNPDSASLVTVSTGDTVRAVDFRPKLGISLSGTVLSADTQTPIEGVPVVAELEGSDLRVRTVSGTDGGFRLDRLADGTGLPSGEWIVRTDSLAVVPLTATPILGFDLTVAPISEGLLLSFSLPTKEVFDWHIERTAGGGFPERVAGARTHPDGLRARAWVDPDWPPGARYRLIAIFSRGATTDSLRTGWIQAPEDPHAMMEMFPQPWSGRGGVILPIPPARGEEITLYGIDGGRISAFHIEGNRIDAGHLRSLANGIYFLRWRDEAGNVWIRRLVVER